MLTRAEKIELIALLEEKQRRKRENAITALFPDEGPLRRELYAKHLEWFASTLNADGAQGAIESLFLAANRVGKTIAGGYAASVSATGLYPDWWPGVRWNRPTDGWAAGDTAKTVRDIQQEVLLGKPGQWGTGLIPKRCIAKVTVRSGVADAVDTIHVKHVSGGISLITLKSYDQRRESFQGTAKDYIWADEELPMDIYAECLLRLMTTNGRFWLTFTPLQGLTEVVLAFLEEGSLDRPVKSRTKRVISATWDDAPHLSEDAKQSLYAALPPYQRDARSKGIPQLGSGAIYPVPESEITVPDFPIPEWWPRGYGLDVGWNFSAWGKWARDPDSGIHYLYEARKVSNMRPAEVVKAIHASDGRIRGVIDPAARGRGQADGQQLLQTYRDLGADVIEANNAVEAGIYEVWQRLVGGRIKFLQHAARELLSEYRVYRRDEKGKIVKDNDHLMDGALRYPVMSFMFDGVPMTQPIRKMSREDEAMWAARPVGESRGNPLSSQV